MVHISELAVRNLLQAQQALGAAAARLRLGTTSAAHNKEQPPVSPAQGPLAQVSEAISRAEQAILLTNACPLDMAFSQAGVDEVITLPAGGCRLYSWHVHPALLPSTRRLLRLCLLSSQTRTPLALREGTSAEGDAHESALLWSAPFDATSGSMTWLTLETPERLSTALAIHVEKVIETLFKTFMSAFCQALYELLL